MLQFNNYTSTISFTNGNTTLGAAIGAPSTLSGSIGSSNLTYNGPGTLVLTGSNNFGGNTNINAGTLVIGTPQALPTLAQVSIGTATTNGTLKLGDGIGGVTLSTLLVNSGSTLNITNNAVTIAYGSNTDPISMIQSYLADGAHANWAGGEISSSSVANANATQNKLIYAIGYSDGADGQSVVSSGVIEILPTLAGDAELKGNVVFGDFQILAANFGQSGGWDQGNFTYGSIVNFGDFQLLAQNFGANSSGLTSGQIASLSGFAAENGEKLVANPSGVGFSLVSVPEPASVGLIAAAGIGLLARRRRRQDNAK